MTVEVVGEMTYDCEICHGLNHAVRFHCSTCGTIPARYSWTGKPIRERLDSDDIEVFAAIGCERQQSRRAVTRAARTVPLDYYAEI